MIGIRIACLRSVCCASLLALALPAMAQEASGNAGQEQGGEDATGAKTLDAVTVTGTRIKRTEVAAALPVMVMQKEEIEAQGITSAEQLLQFLNVASNSADSLAANSGIAPPDTRGNNGVSGANLRGQGSDATLVLLNGRRVATHGLAGQVVDLNSIPFAAIERVEVLRDGASAVYGTDAIGGVINFITRTEFQGLSVTAGADVTQEGGGDIYRASVFGGFGDLDSDRWNVWGALSVKENKILRGVDRDFANSFQPDRGLSPDTRGPPFATVFNQTGGIIIGSLVDPEDGESRTAVNLLDLPGGPGCEAGGDLMGPYDHQIWSSSGSKYACAWDYGRARVIQQPVESSQVIGRATFKMADEHLAYLEFMGSRVESRRQFEAQQFSSSTTVSASSLDPSTWYPLNSLTQDTYDMVYDGLAAYFGEDNLAYGNPIAYRWRCIACGPREIETTTKATRLLLGFEGVIGSWDYSAGLSRAVSRAESVLAGGYYFTPQLKQILGSGLLNPFLLAGQEQSAEALAALQAASASGVQLYGGESTSTIFDASFSGGLGFELPGGEVQAAVGVDLRREEYEFTGPADAALGNAWVFGAPGDSQNYLPKVSRDVKAAFAEIYLPVFDSLEVTLAGRHDRYDGFGGTTNPKYSFKYQPADWLAFRGAYSTGFKVPSFAQLFRDSAETQYTNLDLADPATCPGGIYNPQVAGCDVQIQPDILIGGNPALEPEESKQKSFGVVIAPTANFNVSIDWWEIERLNTIRSGFDLDDMRADYDRYAANFIRDANGDILLIDQRFINTGGSLTRGIELDANLTGELWGGNYHLNLNGSYLDTYRKKDFNAEPYGDNLVGKYEPYLNLPLEWKHTLSFGWNKGAFTHTLTQVYRDGYEDYLPPGMRNGTYVPPNYDPDVDAYITYNYSLGWEVSDALKATFGIRNLLNTDPPFTLRYLDHGDGAAWESRIADPRGRSFTLQVEFNYW
ncbi:TonB-dependent receptor domain-containing protein [Luteimonas sp. 22616]|uniref:TonB-dependent receptor domain-containing protein n=1 Tax=Luteimonas sp. 22616 TaxID=3453951 RepID=UPI003F829E7E